MISPDENTLRALINLSKSNDANWFAFLSWLKESYLREGMNTNEIEDEAKTAISKGSVRQLRQLLGIIDHAEDLLQRQIDAAKKASVQ